MAVTSEWQIRFIPLFSVCGICVILLEPNHKYVPQSSCLCSHPAHTHFLIGICCTRILHRLAPFSFSPMTLTMCSVHFLLQIHLDCNVHPYPSVWKGDLRIFSRFPPQSMNSREPVPSSTLVSTVGGGRNVEKQKNFLPFRSLPNN